MSTMSTSSSAGFIRYTAFNCPNVASSIRGCQTLAGVSEAPTLPPVSLASVRSLSKSDAKNKVKGFEAIEKQLDSDVSAVI